MLRPGLCAIILCGCSIAAAADPAVDFERKDDRLDIHIGGRPFATYVFRDEQIPRPYLMHVHSPSGLQVTRTHPPVRGVDLDDHPTYHPGIWLAFGDLSGADFWRNRARVRHVKFAEEPRGGPGTGSFAVLNSYEADGRALCTERCEITIRVRPDGYLLTWVSTFRSADGEFVFGDQEEMGLGIRMATPLAVVNGGEIRNSDGLVNEAQVWGKQADWCRYSGRLDGRQVGVILMPDPRNFRRSWFHARDYGLLTANPFGRNAFTRGEKSAIVVKPGEALRLGFGVFIDDAPPGESPDPAAVYRDYVHQASREDHRN